MENSDTTVMDTPKKDNNPNNNIEIDDEQTTDALLNGTQMPEKKSDIGSRRHSSFFNIAFMHAHDDDSFQGKCYRLIHTINFQAVVVGFVVLDCIFIIAELIIDLRITKSEVCDKVTCEPIKSDHSLSLILQSISLAILSLFIVELLFKLYVLRLDFFKSKMEIFDSIIVIVSWSLDIVFFQHEDHAINLLIFLRMWRLVRVIHAIALSMRKPIEHQLKQEKYTHNITEARLEKLFNYTKELEEEIKDLRDLLQDFVETLPSTKHKKISKLRIRRKSTGDK